MLLLILFQMVSNMKIYLNKCIFNVLDLTLPIVKLGSLVGLKLEYFQASLLITHQAYLLSDLCFHIMGH